MSKGNSKRELRIKYELYQEGGVLEYWIVYPNDQAIHQFVLDDAGRYTLRGHKLRFLDCPHPSPLPEGEGEQSRNLWPRKVYQLKTMYTDNDVATPYLFPNLAVDLTEVFED